MDNLLFTSVDQYLDRLFAPSDPALDEAVNSLTRAGIRHIEVTPAQGKLLYLLAKLAGAKRILELGTLSGYSAIWMARALPRDGKLVTLEYEPKHAEIARANFKVAGLADRIEIVEGPALDTLPGLAKRGEKPFDMVFIDADKISYTKYLKLVIPMCRSGALIVADNVVRSGNVIQDPPSEESAAGAREFNAALAADPRVEATAIQVVGAKGYDGLAFAVVR